MTTEHSKATFKAEAKDVWTVLGPAEETRSLSYIRIAKVKPSKSVATADALYKLLPQGWQDTISSESFGATLSLAGRIIRQFDEQKGAGFWPKFATVDEFVAHNKSLGKSLKKLNPAKVDSTDAPKMAKATTETKTETKAETKVTAPVVDKFTQVCELIDELNESDLKALHMLVGDKIQKMQAKATAKV